MNNSYSETENNSLPLDIKDIPVLRYPDFFDQVTLLLKNPANHCVNYYAAATTGAVKYFCCIADDIDKKIRILAHESDNNEQILMSLTPECPSMHIFEREIFENFGVEFRDHPWLKPVRYPQNRPDRSRVMDNYPFYEIESEELHEVGVGPVHAGVIEPGHFRFICNGEKVLHLEIQLGYQHRGIERLFQDLNSSLQRCILSESIAGDSSVAHGLAHSQLIESLAGPDVGETLQIERCIGLELERIAVHIGDTAALCGDVAYQLGQVTCEALRTVVINTMQFWCGNRFGKGLIRPGGTNYPLNDTIAEEILKNLDNIGRRFDRITSMIYSLPSVLARFEDIGTVTKQQALSTGAVGMTARTCGVLRDIRSTHPFQYYKYYPVSPAILDAGDVLARGKIRSLEVRESIRIVHDLIDQWRRTNREIGKPVYDYNLRPDSYAVSLIEGWRGEICHSAATDASGKIMHYKVKDPSLHNWMALALAVRDQEISDFPVCNKSFNLSYCGNDL
ncbi:MAG: NADH-quinone oxidoreductase subunit C [Bacteroidales bacterium]|nr:NADH-quinone oxidoreductase subunit C [Bacteroidales bacterium]